MLNNKFKKILVYASLVFIFVSFQNCRSLDAPQSQTPPGELKGNGDGYEGKITYYAVDSEFTCEGIPAVKEYINIFPTHAIHITNLTDKCDALSKQVSLQDLNFKFGEDKVLAFEGINYFFHEKKFLSENHELLETIHSCEFYSQAYEIQVSYYAAMNNNTQQYDDFFKYERYSYEGNTSTLVDAYFMPAMVNYTTVGDIQTLTITNPESFSRSVSLTTIYDLSIEPPPYYFPGTYNDFHIPIVDHILDCKGVYGEGRQVR
ncbi:MAG: hypothetical protein HOO06_06935 [Bdellovibrionaceae bacterium]|nr:hypothetical protein [Pseudobdellovibrionaceae bacterium]